MFTVIIFTFNFVTRETISNARTKYNIMNEIKEVRDRVIVIGKDSF